MNNIGQKIREKRRELKLSQKDVAKKVDVAYATIAAIENETKGNLKTLIAVCDELNLNIELTDRL